MFCNSSFYCSNFLILIKTHLTLGLATLLERVHKQFLTVNFKTICLLYLTVLICCDVGDSDLILKPRCVSIGGLYKKCNVKSENVLSYGKYMSPVSPVFNTDSHLAAAGKV